VLGPAIHQPFLQVSILAVDDLCRADCGCEEGRGHAQTSRPWVGFFGGEEAVRRRRARLLDTSCDFIDGRIADIAETGFP